MCHVLVILKYLYRGFHYLLVMKRSLIVALDQEWGMGNRGFPQPLPVYVPEDLQHFKETTTGNTLLCGRKTFETFPEKPLPNRNTIVLSHQSEQSLQDEYGVHDNLYFADGFEDGLSMHYLDLSDTTLYVAGGQTVYQSALEQGLVDEALISRFPISLGCDMRFPRETFQQYDWDANHRVIRTEADTGFNEFRIEQYTKESL